MERAYNSSKTGRDAESSAKAAPRSIPISIAGNSGKNSN
jgi:hypothetical protein